MRAATAACHERVDALFSAFDLSTLEGYSAFLAAQAEAHVPIEAALDDAGIERIVPDWAERKRGSFILADLSDLGRHPEGWDWDDAGALRLDDKEGKAALLGALYVLEGSRLGGSVLKRQVPAHLPTRFLGAPQQPGAWRKLLEMLDVFLYEPALVDAAAGAARQVFESFERAGKRVLENV
ncbi:biliverdin-producing heme oxygenase [Allosphingosinicella flava]|uniref:Biliverdin-producing heme oxygenase n=1 Tax=Allosphingosinicella flava TaxID=2771430 RepID=A0A7T2LNH0_9SPHN|nr:biliverdin-producing heme oxygenase [Sphingosinicella flava]